MCISACAWGLRGREGPGGVGGMFLCACVYVCVCVCVHGRYLEGLTVGGEREKERERETVRESSLCL